MVTAQTTWEWVLEPPGAPLPHPPGGSVRLFHTVNLLGKLSSEIDLWVEKKVCKPLKERQDFSSWGGELFLGHLCRQTVLLLSPTGFHSSHSLGGLAWCGAGWRAVKSNLGSW